MINPPFVDNIRQNSIKNNQESYRAFPALAMNFLKKEQKKA
jgi:hypothetical protein